jgi:2-polyprenyl-6-methoxyphenol hydroxylase-like FAD-dependent oxidoreductase
VEERGDKIAVQLSDGSTDEFDLVAGFDGIRSDTRKWLVGNVFMPRPSGYGAWRVQVPRPDYVEGMEFLQGIGSKTGAMPLSEHLMYVFHIRPESPDAFFERADMVDLFRSRLAQYGSYVAELRDALNEQSDIVYSPIEPMLLPWPWYHGRVVIGGDAAHTFPPHLTQGAAMAAEDGYVLAKEVLDFSRPIEARLMAYSQSRYARSAFVYVFAREWLEEEQSVRNAGDLETAQAEMAQNASARIAASDRILNTRVF